MSVIEAVVLGIIQGLSEFLPISSTAHLTIAGKVMGLIDNSNPERWTAFIAMIQMGTLLAVLIYFSKEIITIPKAFLSENIGKDRKKYKEQGTESKLGWYIILGSVPIVVVGLLLKDLIEGQLTKELLVISISLIGLALLMGVAEIAAKHKKDMNKMSMTDAVFMGIAQCFALIPGASRSGTTMTAGLFTGLTRETAARFSFLLSIPAVLGSGLLEFYQSLEYINGSDMLAIIIATASAAISGYAAIAFMIRFLKNHSTFLFIAYRIALGLVILLFFVKI